MVILFMTHRQPLLHELFAAFGIDADAHWIAGRRGVVAEDLSHLVAVSYTHLTLPTIYSV